MTDKDLLVVALTARTVPGTFSAMVTGVVQELLATRAELRAELELSERRRALLAANTWSDSLHCNECEELEHTPDCAIAAALKEG